LNVEKQRCAEIVEVNNGQWEPSEAHVSAHLSRYLLISIN